MPASVTPDAWGSGPWPHAGRVPPDDTPRRARAPAIATAVVVAQGLTLVAFGAAHGRAVG